MSSEKNRSDFPLIERVLKERYPLASFAYFHGSRLNGNFGKTSDIDLVIVSEQTIQPFREKFLADGALFDVFVYDLETLNGALHSARTGGNFATVDALLSSETIPAETVHSRTLREIAKRVRAAGFLFKNDSNARQYITNVIDDISDCTVLSEVRMLSIDLYRALAEIILIKKGAGICSRKHAAKMLRKIDAAMNAKFEDALTRALAGQPSNLLAFANDVLANLGGPLRDGYYHALGDGMRMPLPLL